MSTKQPTTIVLANRPRLLRELLRFALVGAGDAFHVVVVDNEGDLAATLRKVAPDWVVVTSPPKLDQQEVKSAWLTISQDGSRLRALLPAQLAGVQDAEGSEASNATFTDISLNELLALFRSNDPSAGRAAA